MRMTLMVGTTLYLVSAAVAQTDYGKRRDVLAHFGCGKPECDLKCWLGGKETNYKYSEAYVFQHKEHPNRTWVSVDGWHHLLGDGDGCKFGNPPSTPIGTSAQQAQPPSTPLPQFNPPRPSIGPLPRQ